jgi:hypothetical protein
MIEWVEARGGFLVSYVQRWLAHEMGSISQYYREHGARFARKTLRQLLFPD